eukprot:m.232939 g.232939  ORF g.232939 m.232939 type:complete len:98 (-) comp22451_c0_seq4:15-308(-)
MHQNNLSLTLTALASEHTAAAANNTDNNIAVPVFRSFFCVLCFALGSLEMESHHVVCRGHRKAVSALCCSGDGSLVLSASLDHTVRLWSAEGEPLNK